MGRTRRYRTAAIATSAAVVVAAAVGIGVTWDSRRGAVTDTDTESAPLNLAPDGSRPVPLERSADGTLRAYFVGDELAEGHEPAMVAELESRGPTEVSTSRRTSVTAQDGFVPLPEADGSGVVFVNVGTVDSRQGTAIEPFSLAYGSMLDEIALRSPNAVVVCAGTWNPAATGHPIDYAIQTQCVARGGRFRTLADLYDRGDTHDADEVTAEGGVGDPKAPNSIGHDAIAERLMSAVSVPAQ